MDIAQWLTNLELTQYVDAFRQNDIDEGILVGLTNEDLKDIGILSFGHRKAILSAIACLTQQPAVALEDMPSFLAVPIGEYYREEDPVLKLWHACDLFELLLRFAVIVSVADILHRRGRLPDDLVAIIRPNIEEPTMGMWKNMAQAVARHIEPSKSLMPEMTGLIEEVLVPILEGTERPRSEYNSFIRLRNQLAHGSGVTKPVASHLLNAWQPRIEQAIDHLHWLPELTFVGRDNTYVILQGTTNLFRPYSIEDNGLRKAIESCLSREDCVALVRDGEVVPIWPLALFGIPHRADIQEICATRPAPQVFTRRGKMLLQYTPIGSSEVAMSESDETALDRFLNMFHLGETSATRPPTGLEVVGFEHDILRDATHVVGRHWELEHLREQLMNLTSGVLWLTGPAGIGKSYLLSRLTAGLLQQPPERTLILPYRFKAGDHRCTREMFLQFAVERLETWCQLLLAGYCSDANRFDRFKWLLENIGDTRLIFILDGMDEIAEKDRRFAEDFPLNLATPTVIWMCAGRPERGLPEAFTPDRCHHVFPNGVPPMDARDVRTMLLEKIGPIRKRLLVRDMEDNEGRVINPFIERVTSNADGLPIYVTYVVGDILLGRIGDFSDREMSTLLPPTLERYHEELLRRCSIGTLHQMLTPLMATLAVATEPLSLGALKHILCRLNVIPPSENADDLLFRGLSAISSMLRRLETPEEEHGYTVFHHSLRQHMEKSEHTRGSLETARRNLADLFFDTSAHQSMAGPYLRRWGVRHAIEAAQVDKLMRFVSESPSEFTLTTIQTMAEMLRASQGQMLPKVKELLCLFAQREDDQAVSIITHTGLMLIESNYADVAHQIADLLPARRDTSQHVKLAFGLKQAELESRFETVKRVARQLLEVPDLPPNLEGLARYYLGQAFRIDESGSSTRCFRAAGDLLDPEIDYLLWMQAQIWTADDDYCRGLISESLHTFARLLEMAESRRSVRLMALIHDLTGTVHNEIGNFEIAETHLRKSIKLHKSIRHSGEITAMKDLAYNLVYTQPAIAGGLIQESRQMAAASRMWREYGLTYLIEALWQLELGQAADALACLSEADRILTRVGYKSGLARTALTKAQAEMKCNNYERALMAALGCHRYYLNP